MATTKKHEGGCFCGKIRYYVDGDPITFFICHCRNCQKYTGTAFASNAFFPIERLHITKGEHDLKYHEDNSTASGHPLRRAFCSECGSLVLGKPANSPDIIFIASGSFDDPLQFPPRKEVHTEGNRRPWIGDIHLQSKSRSKAKL
ncbi:Mss4-like protein [Flagelloscypha sp. PMI_526]|nr:Mss4-like protein [Flagelloscypha sp. PMI_526]